MNVHIETQGFEPTPAITAWVNQEIAIALQRFDADIRSIDVYLTTSPGHAGAPGTSAAVNVFLKHRSPVRITTLHTDLYTAISISAKRSELTVERNLGKQRRWQRLELRRLRNGSALTSPI